MTLTANTPTFDEAHIQEWLWQCWNCGRRTRTLTSHKPPNYNCPAAEWNMLEPCQWFSKGIDHRPKPEGR